MKQIDCNTKKRKYTHIKEKDRYKIEVLLQGKKSAREIAVILGRDKATIYREIERGTVTGCVIIKKTLQKCKKHNSKRWLFAKMLLIAQIYALLFL